MGTGSGKEKMAFLQEDGKHKGAEVGKHRPNSGNVSRLAGLHLQELAQDGWESRLECGLRARQ